MSLEKRILIVEDDPTIRTLVLTVLRKRGWRADVASDGVEATDKLQDCRYALLIVDLMMPRMSGFEVVERVNAMRKEIRPLVLILTAGGNPRGFDTTTVVGLIQKPFDIDLLLKTVSGILAGIDDLPQLDTCVDRSLDLQPEDTN